MCRNRFVLVDDMYVEFLNVYRTEFGRLLWIIQFWEIELLVLMVHYVGHKQVWMMRINVLAVFLLWAMSIHVREYRRYQKRIIKKYKEYLRAENKMKEKR